MQNEKLKKLSLKLVSNPNDWMSSFRKNIDMYISEKDITIRELSEVADINFETLKSFIYGDAKDCKLSTAIKLAKALHISIEELVGAGTISPKAKEAMALYRNLPEHDQYLILWYINYLTSLNNQGNSKSTTRSVMDIECFNGYLKLTSIYHKADISQVPAEMRTKIFFGIKMPCDHYMPVYSPYETLLIANDRLPMNNENCLIRVEKDIFIAKVKMENNEMKFYSIRDGKFRLNRDEVDEVVGYVATTIIEK